MGTVAALALERTGRTARMVAMTIGIRKEKAIETG